MAVINGIDASKNIDFAYSGNAFSARSELSNNILVRGTEAVKNTIKMFLISQAGDYRRDVLRGGPMIRVIGKPLNDEYKAKIEKIVEDALATYSNIIVIQVNARMDIDNKMWIVNVAFADKYNKVQDSMNLGVPGV